MSTGLIDLEVGTSSTVITSKKIDRSFEVSLRVDGKYQVLDLATETSYAINTESIENLKEKNYEDAEALEILIFIKETLSEIFNISYADMTKAISKIAEVYESPSWVIGEIENLTIGQLIDLFKSPEPVKIFKEIAD